MIMKFVIHLLGKQIENTGFRQNDESNEDFAAGRYRMCKSRKNCSGSKEQDTRLHHAKLGK